MWRFNSCILVKIYLSKEGQQLSDKELLHIFQDHNLTSMQHCSDNCYMGWAYYGNKRIWQRDLLAASYFAAVEYC